ncbi:MAG: GNAT family N-acetyltransferase [Candidatus Sumerlaeaceae bacterium]
MATAADFTFLEFADAEDAELSVVLIGTTRPEPERHWAAAYDFELRVNGEHAGSINFRAQDTENLRLYGGHFAYGVEPEFRGHHYAERGVRLLLPFARAHGYADVIITCNPDNWASRRTCDRLGAELLEIVALPPDNDMYLEGEREKCRYRVVL